MHSRRLVLSLHRSWLVFEPLKEKCYDSSNANVSWLALIIGPTAFARRTAKVPQRVAPRPPGKIPRRRRSSPKIQFCSIRPVECPLPCSEFPDGNLWIVLPRRLSPTGIGDLDSRHPPSGSCTVVSQSASRCRHSIIVQNCPVGLSTTSGLLLRADPRLSGLKFLNKNSQWNSRKLCIDKKTRYLGILWIDESGILCQRRRLRLDIHFNIDFEAEATMLTPFLHSSDRLPGLNRLDKNT